MLEIQTLWPFNCPFSKEEIKEKQEEPLYTYNLGLELCTSLFGCVRYASLGVDSYAIKISNKILMNEKRTLDGLLVTESILNEVECLRYLHDEIDRTSEKGLQYLQSLVETFEDDEFHFLVTPYARGGDLFNFLEQQPNHRVNEKTAKLWFYQLLLGLQSLHHRGITHCDISLENILVYSIDHVVLSDFGVCKKFDLQFSPRTSTFCSPSITFKPGKIGYMSPELYGNQPWNPFANDCFQLGVCLFAMLTGYSPFKIPHESDVLFASIRSGKWVSNSACTHLSKSVLHLLDCLFSSQQQRPSVDLLLGHPWLSS